MKARFRSPCGPWLLLAIVLPALAASDLRPTSQVPPGDDDDDRVAFGKLAFQNDCLMCHGAGIVEQQRLTSTQWKAELKKMIDQGATVAAEDVPQIQAYLEAAFGPNHRIIDTLRAAAEVKRTAAGQLPEPLAGVVPERGRALFAEQCAKCHGTDARGGEPGQNLVEQVSLLEVQPFRQVVTVGRRKMPGFRDVLGDAQIDDILAWLRTLRYEPGAPPNASR